MKAAHVVDRWWMQPIGPQALAVFRIAVGAFAVVYLVIRWPNLVSGTGFESHQFEPIGMTTVLGDPLAGWLVYLLTIAAIATGIAFVAGWRFALSGPSFALLLLWVITYRNSWGQVFHTENLLVLHVLVLGLSSSADALSLDARRRGARAAEGIAYGWPLRLCGLITVIAYVITGMTKLETSGLEWVTSDSLRNHVAYDNLRKELLGDYYAPLGTWLVSYGWVFKPLAVGTLLVELGAPVALLGRRFALWWAGAAWLFHVGVLATMAILFPYQLLGLAFLPLLHWDAKPVVARVERWTKAIEARLMPRRNERGRAAETP
jgi:hypothetical protein